MMTGVIRYRPSDVKEAMSVQRFPIGQPLPLVVLLLSASAMTVGTGRETGVGLDAEERIHRVAKFGDRAAFADLFSHFAPRIKSYMLRLGASQGEAEDLAQEAMVSVWRKAAQFECRKAAATTWIFAIARNLRIDRLRREHRPEIDPDDPTLVPDDAPLADQLVSTQQTKESVRRALRDLPEEQVRVVEMSFFEDMPHAAISESLGIPLGTVKSRLRLAMNRLRDALGDVR
jgi:RNA polymerase sigma-70 factor (ECF subfamily)